MVVVVVVVLVVMVVVVVGGSGSGTGSGVVNFRNEDPKILMLHVTWLLLHLISYIIQCQ